MENVLNRHHCINTELHRLRVAPPFDRYHVTFDRYHVTFDRYHVTFDRYHVTFDRYHVTFDRYHVTFDPSPRRDIPQIETVEIQTVDLHI